LPGRDYAARYLFYSGVVFISVHAIVEIYYKD